MEEILTGITYFLQRYFLLFLCYAFGGWIMEEIHCSIIEKKLVNRGFLLGPICPIYGIGGVFITLTLSKFMEHPITVFVMAVFLCAILEYFTSVIMEKLFNARWWDYSDKKFNLNGRICLDTLIPFGFFGWLILYFINPFFFNVIDKLTDVQRPFVSWIFAILLIIDIIISLRTILKVTKTAELISEENIKDNTNVINKKVRKELSKNFDTRRIMKAFPTFESLTVKVKNAAIKGKDIVITTAKKTAKKTTKVVKGKSNTENKEE